MVNRSPKLVNGETIGAPFISLGELPVETWTEEKCPLCKAGKPVNIRVGHGKKYLSSKQI
jgi:orotate phosphoribosyltransferase